MDEAINRSVCTTRLLYFLKWIWTKKSASGMGMRRLGSTGGSVLSRFTILIVLLALKETEIK